VDMGRGESNEIKPDKTKKVAIPFWKTVHREKITKKLQIKRIMS